MSKKKRFFIDLSNDLFNRVQRRTEMLARGNPDMLESHIINDVQRDKDVLGDYFKDFISEFQNETGKTGDVRDYGGTLMYQMSEDETERELDKLKGLVVQIAEEYLLMRWFNGLGQLDRSEFQRAVYKKLLRKWRGNSTQKAFVTPKYRPYF